MQTQLRKSFYIIKPLIPRRVQIILRRAYVHLQRRRYSDVWPINECAASPPEGWEGWPCNKSFAVILTHDVEGQAGHDKCRQLLELEQELGFRSSFNFVPEGYNVSEDLRNHITNNGFEVGVHGLTHDGKLFDDKVTFDQNAVKINHYLKTWNAVGFRAPAMHHNLEWIKQLNIDYDLSTFDTDPFEPQSDGVNTIFPFWYGDRHEGYVEIPYTLAQDFSLFVLLQERSISIWKHKVAWIVSKGGMVVVNVHPDYINFNDRETRFDEYPVAHYVDLLTYLKTTYNNNFWNPLPKELATFITESYGHSGKHLETK